MLSDAITMKPSEEAEIRELHRLLKLGTPALIGPGGDRLELPDSVYTVLKDVVGNMMRGRTVFVTPQNNRLTTQAAADLMGFSRPHLIKLLDAGVIPFERVGQHRRVYLKDAVSYQKKRDADRKAALNRLAREEFENGSYEAMPIPAGGSDE